MDVWIAEYKAALFSAVIGVASFLHGFETKKTFCYITSANFGDFGRIKQLSACPFVHIIFLFSNRPWVWPPWQKCRVRANRGMFWDGVVLAFVLHPFLLCPEIGCNYSLFLYVSCQQKHKVLDSPGKVEQLHLLCQCCSFLTLLIWHNKV